MIGVGTYPPPQVCHASMAPPLWMKLGWALFRARLPLHIMELERTTERHMRWRTYAHISEYSLFHFQANRDAILLSAARVAGPATPSTE